MSDNIEEKGDQRANAFFQATQPHLEQLMFYDLPVKELERLRADPESADVARLVAEIERLRGVVEKMWRGNRRAMAMYLQLFDDHLAQGDQLAALNLLSQPREIDIDLPPMPDAFISEEWRHYFKVFNDIITDIVKRQVNLEVIMRSTLATEFEALRELHGKASDVIQATQATMNSEQ